MSSAEVSSPASSRRRMPRFRATTTVLFLALAGWLVMTAVLIYRTPDDGERTTAELATKFEAALRANSVDQAKRLIAAPPDDDEAVSSLLAAARCDGPSTRVHGVDRDPRSGYLALTDRAGGSCGRIPVARHEQRSFIDPWAEPVHGKS